MLGILRSTTSAASTVAPTGNATFSYRSTLVKDGQSLPVSGSLTVADGHVQSLTASFASSMPPLTATFTHIDSAPPVTAPAHASAMSMSC
jgi:hypothetical protein